MSKPVVRSSAKWRAQRLRVLERDSYTCAYCGKTELTGADATVDHIVSVHESGRAYDEYEDWELVSACNKCNTTKGTRPLLRRAYLNPKYVTK